MLSRSNADSYDLTLKEIIFLESNKELTLRLPSLKRNIARALFFLRFKYSLKGVYLQSTSDDSFVLRNVSSRKVKLSERFLQFLIIPNDPDYNERDLMDVNMDEYDFSIPIYTSKKAITPCNSAHRIIKEFYKKVEDWESNRDDRPRI